MTQASIAIQQFYRLYKIQREASCAACILSTVVIKERSQHIASLAWIHWTMAPVTATRRHRGGIDFNARMLAYGSLHILDRLDRKLYALSMVLRDTSSPISAISSYHHCTSRMPLYGTHQGRRPCYLSGSRCDSRCCLDLNMHPLHERLHHSTIYAFLAFRRKMGAYIDNIRDPRLIVVWKSAGEGLIT
ncbi:predicted protein [Lichtheimia corymbifera JMRC:FSU:9682]|uniref:Uncharacterized protein n=1 Tax=Lichtheimia corymbifera JMRC:FSU:9682 TaxID=1263082 RepID=A0A068S6I8_9FUNG|nr:predicted protein [Lichtheimia corymbifera JMRC:FSU:9682]